MLASIPPERGVTFAKSFYSGRRVHFAHQKVCCFYRHGGLTLPEILVVLSLLAITLSGAVPAFAAHRDYVRLKQASMQLVTDLQLARSESALRNLPVRWSWQPYPEGSCYILHTGRSTSCPCTLLSVHCEPGSLLLKSVRWGRKDQISLQSNVTSIRFDPTLGTSTPAARLKLTTSQGKSIDHVINIMGRIRTCSTPDNRLGLPGC
ncbi:MAG: GspH/FimT family pseudopilin [Burkholderiales bacterium]